MTAPDFSHGYLRIPLAVWLSVYCRTSLTRRQLQLVSLVLRESWGWRTRDGRVHTWTRPLSTRQFAEGTGLPLDHLLREIDRLVARGILRRQGERYQFCAEPAMWITLPASARELRGIAPEWPDGEGENALRNLGSKIRERKQRNVRTASETEISTAGENPSSRSSSSRLFDQAAGAAGISAAAAERLADIVAAFVGSLTPSQSEILRLWIYQEGVAAVWSTLEPSFREGALPGRLKLEDVLNERGQR